MCFLPMKRTTEQIWFSVLLHGLHWFTTLCLLSGKLWFNFGDHRNAETLAWLALVRTQLQCFLHIVSLLFQISHTPCNAQIHRSAISGLLTRLTRHGWVCLSHGGYHMVGITWWVSPCGHGIFFFGTMAAMASLGFNVFTTSRHDPKLRRSPGDPRPTLDDKDKPIASPRFATFRHVSPMGQPMGQPMVQRISQKFGIFLMVTPREKMDSGWLQPWQNSSLEIGIPGKSRWNVRNVPNPSKLFQTPPLISWNLSQKTFLGLGFRWFRWFRWFRYV